MHVLTTDVLVVGGGTGGTAAALQAARRGAQTILVSEFPWLGGMLTSAGVSAPDGNELVAFQMGIWGAFLRELERRQPSRLDHAWVSFFTYDPRVGAQIFADWVKELPNLQWIAGQTPLEVSRQNDRITGVRFADYSIQAKIIIDGTELGDLLELAAIPHRWGWELQSIWQEPSAPVAPTPLTQHYPVQSPTWVVILQDFGAGAVAPEIPAPPSYNPSQFIGAWEAYGADRFLNYGRLPGDRFMLNWPQKGNDYGEGIDRLIHSPAARLEFLQESRWHTQGFARYIQTEINRRYGLATQIFPTGLPDSLGGDAYALHPYYRESRRLQGLVTLREQDILPFPSGQVAPLPIDVDGATSIALGNYANDHHYPGYELTVQPKSLRWGGRWTGTPFTIPYGCLIPTATDGFLVCEKNSSVSHIANGVTRLQPVVLGIGQAAGMAAALCIERNCQPRELPTQLLQEALLHDPIAPAAVIPLFNLPPAHPDWLYWQHYYLRHPDEYPLTGNCPLPQKSGLSSNYNSLLVPQSTCQEFIGIFQAEPEQTYILLVSQPLSLADQSITLVTLQPDVAQTLQTLVNAQTLKVWGRFNRSGNWILVERVESQLD